MSGELYRIVFKWKCSQEKRHFSEIKIYVKYLEAGVGIAIFPVKAKNGNSPQKIFLPMFKRIRYVFALFDFR